MAQNNKNKIKVGIVEKNRRLRESLAESIRSQNNMVVAFSIPELDGHSTAADVVLSGRSSPDLVSSVVGQI